MKIILRSIATLIFVSTLAFVQPVLAEGWYFGVKGGPVVLDLPSLDDPVNAGVVLGHDWGVVIGDIGVEAEATTTVANGKNDDNGVDVKTGGLFGAVRTAGPIYLKARLGYAVYDFTGVSGQSEANVAYGLAFGVSVGIVQFELEYTKMDSDVNTITLGVLF
jgi:outer membrane immunogenic protein